MVVSWASLLYWFLDLRWGCVRLFVVGFALGGVDLPLGLLGGLVLFERLVWCGVMFLFVVCIELFSFGWDLVFGFNWVLYCFAYVLIWVFETACGYLYGVLCVDCSLFCEPGFALWLGWFRLF